MRKTVLSAAHGHAIKQARIEIQMERRHYLSIVCAHSLRMKFMVIAASSPYLFTTTAVGCIMLLLEQAISIRQMELYGHC